MAITEMSETKTLREQALENLGVNTPSWIIEAAESLAESYASPLRERIAELESLMQEFVDRVDRGEVRSKRTYQAFKKALEK